MTLKVIVNGVERDATPEEAMEIQASWKLSVPVVEPAPAADDPIYKLRAFLDANPDVKAMLDQG